MLIIAGDAGAAVRKWILVTVGGHLLAHFRICISCSVICASAFGLGKVDAFLLANSSAPRQHPQQYKQPMLPA